MPRGEAEHTDVVHREDFLGGFRRETDSSHDRLGAGTIEREFGFHALTCLSLGVAIQLAAIAAAKRLFAATAEKYGELA